MKKKGFTLIELLAVIVILAVIALIATPIILNIIEETRKNASMQSARGILDSLEKQLILSYLNEESLITDGSYNINDLEISYKGEKPTNGIVVIYDDEITEARFCISNYSIDYNGNDLYISPNDYCRANKLIIDGQEIPENTMIDLTKYSNKSNISCNNNAKLEVEGNTLKVTNILGEIICTTNNSLTTAVNNLDNSNTSIVMLDNEENISNTIAISDNKKVNLNLNGKKITGTGILIYVRAGELVLNGDGLLKSNILNGGNSVIKKWTSQNSKLTINSNNCNSTNIDEYNSGLLIYSNKSAISEYYDVNNGYSNLTINGGCFVSTEDSAIRSYELGDNHIDINNGIFQGQSAISNMKDGIVNINNGYFYSTDTTNSSATIRQTGTGTININNGYIIGSKTCTSWRCGAIASFGGIVNINGTTAEFENGKYKTGIYVESTYGVTVYGTDSSIKIEDGTFITKTNDNTQSCQTVGSSSNANIIINNGEFSNEEGEILKIQNNGNIYIENGQFYSENQPVYISDNLSNGSLIINGGTYTTKDIAVYNQGSTTAKICSGNINGKKYDLYNVGDGYVYYKSQNVLVNNLIYSKDSTHIVLDSTIKCIN